MSIGFYRVSDPYGCFSNFSAHPFTLDGKVWPTSEHYFQAMKFAGTEHVEAIRKAGSPSVAARMGRSRERPLRKDWESVKEDVMRKALYAKFRTHADIREVLLSTGDEQLVEVTTGDTYWGCGSSGTGKNRLGALLEEVRATLRKEFPAASGQSAQGA